MKFEIERYEITDDPNDLLEGIADKSELMRKSDLIALESWDLQGLYKITIIAEKVEKP